MFAMERDPRLLDMTPDGKFRQPPRMAIGTRIIAGAVIVAVLAAALGIAAFALWIALMLIPVAIAAALVAYLTFRFRVWQARRRAGSVGGERFVAPRPSDFLRRP